MTMIGSYTLEEYIELTREFHGATAPGLLMGGFMVDLALNNLPEGEFFDALCETRACLPDAIQLLTPCSVGNGWLKILDLGRFALTLYEKFTGRGVRVSVDAGKMADWPEVNGWMFKLRPKREQDSKALFEQIIRAGSSIYRLTLVDIHPEFLIKPEKGPIALCPLCQEPYPARSGSVCRACQGETPYDIVKAAHTHAGAEVPA